MNIETVRTCPLGSKCQEIKDGKIHKCAWLIQVAGENPQTGEMADEEACSMTWLPILLIENARVTRGTSAAVESFRNEMVKTTETNNQLLFHVTQNHTNPSTQVLTLSDE